MKMKKIGIISLLVLYLTSCNTMNKNIDVQEYSNRYSSLVYEYQIPEDYEEYVYNYIITNQQNRKIFIEYNVSGSSDEKVLNTNYYNDKKVIEQSYKDSLVVYSFGSIEENVYTKDHEGKLKKTEIDELTDSNFDLSLKYSNVYFESLQTYCDETINIRLLNINLSPELLIMEAEEYHNIEYGENNKQYHIFKKMFFKKGKGLIRIEYLTDQKEVYNTIYLVGKTSKDTFFK